MTSAFGVVHKAAWKSFYPVPPGVRRIPKAKLKLSVERTPEDVRRSGGTYGIPHKTVWSRDTNVVARNTRGQKIGSMQVREGRRSERSTFGAVTRSKDPAYVGRVGVDPGYRRRGVAENMMHAAEREIGERAEHSTARSDLGERFARGVERKRGLRPVQATLQSDIRKPVNSKGFNEREPYYTRHGVQRGRAYRPQTTSRARLGKSAFGIVHRPNRVRRPPRHGPDDTEGRSDVLVRESKKRRIERENGPIPTWTDRLEGRRV